MNAPNLTTLVAHYQKQLRLLDWRIDVSYEKDLASRSGQPVWGLCYPIADAKTATIVVRDPSTPPPGVTSEEAAKQVVETVVHELVHLHFAAFSNRTPTEVVAEEQAVWALAEALVASRGTEEEAVYARAMVAAVDGLTRPEAARKQGVGMDPKDLKAAIEALKNGDGESALAVLEAMLIAAAGGPAAESEGEMPAEEAPAPEYAAAPEAPPEDEEKMAAKAARARLAELTGQETIDGQLEHVERWRKAYIELEKRDEKVAAARAALDATERRSLVTKLIALGAETPATAWQKDRAGLTPKNPTKLVKRLADEPLDELRVRVAQLAKARGGHSEPKPPISSPDFDGVELSERELSKCKARGIDPARYAKTKAQMAARSAVKAV